MACQSNTCALLAGLAWLPWAEDPSSACPSAITEFFGRLNITVSTALSRSSHETELSKWLKNQFGHSHQEKIRWFEVGLHTMVVSRMFADGAAPEVAEDAMTAYRTVLEDAGVSLGVRNQIATLVRKLALDPQDQQVFARLLAVLEDQAQIQSTSATPRPRINHREAVSYYLTVAMVIIMALTSFSKSAPPFALPFILLAGLLLTTAIGSFGAFRD